MDMMFTITGSYQRLNFFFRENSANIAKIINCSQTTVKKDFKAYIARLFEKAGGFDAIEGLL